ncbi:MAG: histidine kinase dimerization/phospho-acceptor domain-containing protein [Polyangiaceae bacterium]
MASRSLEEKAEQLQLISKYKSEFLANMSHELRTPLNSLLISSQLLAENRNQNLTPEQVKFAQTVYTSGHELLSLINEILDLSKVEAGKMPIAPVRVPLEEVRDYLEQTFRHVAGQKDLSFEIAWKLACQLRLYTDVNRLRQILRTFCPTPSSSPRRWWRRRADCDDRMDETRVLRFRYRTAVSYPCG